jgi:hypothetical protein
MKNYTTRRCLCWLVVTVTVSFAQHYIAEAQDTLAQNAVATNSPIEGDDSSAQQISFSPVSEDTLPDTPVPQDQSPEQDQQTPLRDPTPINRIAILPPRLNAGAVLTPHDKWEGLLSQDVFSGGDDFSPHWLWHTDDKS